MSVLPASVALESPVRIGPMCLADVDVVQAIEASAYTHPWTRGNFMDSLASGYRCRTLLDAGNRIIGYVLVMAAAGEAHLLNLTVLPALHGRGLGRMLLDHAVTIAREDRASSMFLEVRPSNIRAIRIYERYGFARIGLRKGYYPAAGGSREDAVVMRIAL